MFQLIIVIIASINIIYVDSYPDTENNQESGSYEIGNKTNDANDITETEETDVNMTENTVLPEVKNTSAQEKPEKLVDSIAKKILDYAKSKPKSRRSMGQDLIEPQVVHFEREKPSVMLKMNTTNLVDILAKALESKTLESYIQYYTRRAAHAYNVIHQKLQETEANNAQ